MHRVIHTLALLASVSTTAHAALRPGSSTGPTMPTPTTPTSLPTGGGSPTLTCVLVPAVCVQ